MLIAAVMLLAACDGQHDAPATAEIPQRWLGQWTGPEGTLLWLSENGAGYTVKIQSLDGPATYQGDGVGDHIEFQRDGKTETIRATGGKETGMKWLMDKRDCLTIKQGEGFCRG
ncbi:hypothetical protein [Hydrocarboniphaga sp.]|uniref:hypothetical protein n=1 Tax=Hydrocarboniphaga sp. TaxID=2033016 RepID=UPI002624052E|nr:hypothetical protein [Hydrocarboniphaga sp.]